MQFAKDFVLVLFSLVFVVILSACGGGGSSGGAGQEFAGTYTGSGSGTVTGGGTTVPFSGGFVIIIDANGSVTYQEGGMTVATTTLNGNQFTLNVPPPPEFAANCTGTIDLNGTLADGGIMGTTSSTGVSCFGVPSTVSGTFTATKTAKTAVTNMTDSLMNAMQKSL